MDKGLCLHLLDGRQPQGQASHVCQSCQLDAVMRPVAWGEPQFRDMGRHPRPCCGGAEVPECGGVQASQALRVNRFQEVHGHVPHVSVCRFHVHDIPHADMAGRRRHVYSDFL